MIIRLPRSVGGRSRHDGLRRAARAAETALSTSVIVAAETEAISDSSLGSVSTKYDGWVSKRLLYVRGVDGGQSLPVAALHPLVVNEEAGRLGVFPAIGRGELN